MLTATPQRRWRGATTDERENGDEDSDEDKDDADASDGDGSDEDDYGGANGALDVFDPHAPKRQKTAPCAAVMTADTQPMSAAMAPAKAAQSVAPRFVVLDD